MEEIIKKLIDMKKTISTMESCTGGAIANEITNIENSSQVFKFSAITYSNEFKIKMGVAETIIDKYSVYSIETAQDMSKKISDFTNSDYGIGITGKLNKIDPNNLVGDNNIVFISVYDKQNNKYFNQEINVSKKNRIANKQFLIKEVEKLLKSILN